MVHTQDDNLTALNEILPDSRGIIFKRYADISSPSVLSKWSATVYAVNLAIEFSGRGSTFSEALHNLNNKVEGHFKKEKK